MVTRRIPIVLCLSLILVFAGSCDARPGRVLYDDAPVYNVSTKDIRESGILFTELMTPIPRYPESDMEFKYLLESFGHDALAH